MEELVSIKNDEAVCDSLKVAEILNGVETAIVRSYEKPLEMSENLEQLNKYLEKLRENFDYPFIANACSEVIMRNFLACTISEADVHNWFKKNVKKLLGSKCDLIKRKNGLKHIPDFWVLNNDEYIPVEIKLNSFGPRHLKQLDRYMKFYKASTGIAVAKRLNCPIPQNIIFIQYKPSEVIHCAE